MSFEPILEPEITLCQKQQITQKCEEPVSTTCLGCPDDLVCERHHDVWND
jgi:hypothetical protein